MAVKPSEASGESLSSGGTVIRIATRRSPLAIAQSREIASYLAELEGSPPCELLAVSTRGDILTDETISAMAGTGVFVKEVQAAVLTGDADIAVHSAKDLPSRDTAGLVIGCVLDRADPRDALVGPFASVFDLPAGALVATGSIRRRVQLAWLRPDLTFSELRGNLHTRLNKIRSSATAGIVAMAAVERLDIYDQDIHSIRTEWMLPQAGQGILAVECRRDDTEMLERLARIDDEQAHLELRAERAFLGEIQGGCSIPAAALAAAVLPAGPHGSAVLEIKGMIASRDGKALVRQSLMGIDPEALGKTLAHDLIYRQGGEVLIGVNRNDQ
ncbi:MAG: hydroxymethylbilane synthase [Acidimicrobiales bacterium]